MSGQRDPLFWRRIAVVWAATALIFIITSWHMIGTAAFPDPDDQMRLLEVRDWLAGQSWFDVTQYRVNAPAGAAMHWSRLVDAPIAATILAMRPFFGAAIAERIALVTVPLVTLGIVMGLLAAYARRMLDEERALLATCMAPICVEVVHQLRPMRIDHHGWQMALALLTILALTGRNLRTSGLIAGAALALWVSISLEGLPFVAAAFALVALRWAIDVRAGPLFAATTAGAATTALVAYVTAHGAPDWSNSACDALSPVYLAMLGVGAAGSILLVGIHPKSMILRLMGLGAVGLVTLTLLPLIAPDCMAGPFGKLDPIVHDFWYMRVGEGLPIWRQNLAAVANTISLPLIGTVGTAMAFRAAAPSDRARWAMVLFMTVSTLAAAILVQRSGGVANLIALPGAIWLVHRLLLRARSIKAPIRRVFTTAAVLALAAPGVAVSLIVQISLDQTETRAVRAAWKCTEAADMAALRQFPTGNILAPLDISPSILLMTDHKVVATGHHRSSAAMRDVIEAFMGTPEAAHAIAQRRHINYFVVCPGLAEPIEFAAIAPNGFWAQLDAGRAPDWLMLRPIRNSPIRVWQVR